MNQFDVVQGFRERTEGGSPTPDHLAGHFLEAIGTLGFRHFACCSHVDPFHPPRQAVMLHNYPQGWVRTFSAAKLYEIDPVFGRAAADPRPFFWDDAFPPGTLRRPQRILLADAAGYGLRHGYTIPLQLAWLPGSLPASCSVVPDRDRVDPGSYLAVEVLATWFYFFACRTHLPRLDRPQAEVTQRERQCLALVALGRDDAGIAGKLGVSVTTVHFHVEQLRQRLGAATRAQAVARALMIGELTTADLERAADS